VIGGPQKVPVGWRYQSEVLLAHVQEYAVVGHQDEEWVQYGQHDEEQHHTAVHKLYDRRKGHGLHPDVEIVLNQRLHVVHQLPRLRYGLPLNKIGINKA